MFQHKGYVLVQGEKCNYHYMIFAPNGKIVMHISYSKPVTEEKAKEFIESYIILAGTLGDIADGLEDDED